MNRQNLIRAVFIQLYTLISCFGLPDVGFNMPPLGIDGMNIDYRDTSTRFFAGF